MKRTKLLLFLISVLAGIFAFTLPEGRAPCEYHQQYYWDGTKYEEVGEYGVDWYCEEAGGNTCTYWHPPDSASHIYVACRGGLYTEIDP